MTANPTPAAAPTARRRSKLPLILAGVMLAPVLAFALYVWTTLSYSYSEGERAGVLQKFSRKGWLCKTYEGELAMTTVPGVAPTIWTFSVRQDTVAARMRDAVGNKVMLHYREHRGVPTSCFGDTPYFVSSLQVLP